ncbi:hypothetical protein V1511DRAFT_507031 [Dipodascopsis uninucleata]
MQAGNIASKACDQCSFRKVKCDRRMPCQKCLSLSFDCTYNRPRRKKGPSGKCIGQIRQGIRIPPSSPASVAEAAPPQESAAAFSEGDSLKTTVSVCPTTSAEDILYPAIHLNVSSNNPPDDNFSLESTESAQLPAAVDTESSYSAAAGSVRSIRLELDMKSIEALTRLKSPSLTAGSSAWPALVSEQILEVLVSTYFVRIAKFLPLIIEDEFLSRLHLREHIYNSSFGALVLSLCAFSLVQPIVKDNAEDASKRNINLQVRITAVKNLMAKAITMRDEDMQYSETPTIVDILTSFFLFSSYYGCQLHHSAWLRLQEAISLAEIVGLHKVNDVEKSITPKEREQRLTVYWVLSVSERAYALQKNHSLLRTKETAPPETLKITTNYHLANTPIGLSRMVKLFSVVDLDIVECWNGKCNGVDQKCRKLTAEKVMDLHKQVSGAYDRYSDNADSLDEIQRADLCISQQWLHNRLWQLCLSHGLLHDYDSGIRELSLLYAFDIARHTISLCKSFSMDSLEVHGVGLTVKLYDIASSVISLLSCLPWLEDIRKEEDKFEQSDREILNQYVALLATFRDGQHPFLVPLMQEMTMLKS